METSQKVLVAIGTIAIVGIAAVGGKYLYSGDGTGTVHSSSSSTSGSSAPIASAPATTAAPTSVGNGTPSAPSSAAAPAPAPTPTPTPTPSGTSTASTSGYKDGQYTASQDYYVPGGDTNTVSVTLTVANGKISSVTANDQYGNGVSAYYVSSFESAVSGDAAGQSLSDYSPSRIGGASLTTEAFAQAIDTIRSQAAA